MKKYFSNSINNCYAIALANALVELDDLNCAKKVLERYNYHPLKLSNNKVWNGCSSRLLRELTQNKYHGKLFVNFYWFEHYNEVVPQNIAKIISEEIADNWIIPWEGELISEDPILIGVWHENYAHYIASGKDGTYYIDNGKIIPPEIPEPLQVIEVQEIKHFKEK